jgi:hypothetical protein
MRGQIEHNEVINGITYTLSIEQDDQPIRGNVSAIDGETDRQAENWVYAQLNNGNLWAWCLVTVTASIERDGVTFEGKDYLGCCSYQNRGEFLQNGYYQDLREEARLQLQQKLLQTAMRGTYAMEILNDLFGMALLKDYLKDQLSTKEGE